MDSESSSDESSSQLHQSPSHSSTLTSQVPQQDLSQIQIQIHQPHPRHPFNLSFPTLNDDGSIPDLTAHQSRQHPTPPAALSSQGIRTKAENMEGKGKDAASDSGASFADSTYDMMDDLSEMSNDDHDTASIASQDLTSGQLTPEYAQSEVDDAEDQTEMLEHVEEHIELPPSPSAASFVTLPSPTSTSTSTTPSDAVQSKHQMKAENDLIDSYTSEDLETPRQSSMPNAFASTYHLSQRKSADRATQAVPLDPSTNKILFISDRDMHNLDMDVICARAAFCIDPADSAGAFDYVVKRLATPPSGIQSSAKVMRGNDGVSAELQHCIGAERRLVDSYKLLVQDADEEYSSFFTVGQDAKIDLPAPKLAVFYLDTFTHGMAWFDTAYNAVQSLNVPILVIRDDDLPAKQATLGSGESKSQLTMDAKPFIEMDRAALKQSFAQLMGQDAPVPSPSRISKLRSSFKKNYMKGGLFAHLLTFFLVALPMAMIYSQYLPSADPVANLAIRRESLTYALDKLSTSANITKAFNIEHLMPPPPTNCTLTSYLGVPLGTSCPVQAHAQDAPPNHVIVSLQNGPREPRLVSVGATKNDGRALNVSQTKLVPGVYHLALDPNEAYGIVNFNIMTNRPVLNISWSNNFGNRLLHRQTYEKASTDLSKIVSKDVAVMRHAAQGITQKVGTEIGAGLSATKNVTSQLALYVTRDLQLAADTAVSVFTNAAKAGKKGKTSLSKDLALMRDGFTHFGENFGKGFKARMEAVKKNSKALIRAPIDMSRQRLALSKVRLGELKRALQKSSAKVPSVPTKKGKKDSFRDRFENSLAATPEHELSGRQKRKAAKVQAKADRNLKEMTRKAREGKERAQKLKDASRSSGKQQQQRV